MIPILYPGFPAVTRGYSLSAPPGHRSISSLKYFFSINRLHAAGAAEPFRVSPPEAVVYLDEIGGGAQRHVLRSAESDRKSV
jgi:hypothetical protein